VEWDFQKGTALQELKITGVVSSPKRLGRVRAYQSSCEKGSKENIAERINFNEFALHAIESISTIQITAFSAP
jgi:hypothetical protein